MAQRGVQLEQETFCCSICLDLLKDPVTTGCGHSYCKSCINNHWDKEEERGSYSCPQCRQTFTPRPVLEKSTMADDIAEKLEKTGIHDAPERTERERELGLQQRRRWTRADFLRYSQQITLDPNTAHTYLLLSEGNRKVKRVIKDQSYSDHPDRFTDCCQVLSRERLNQRCYWEVEVGGTVGVAVAYKNIKRAGDPDECRFGENTKSFMLHFRNRYKFYYNKDKTPVSDPVSSTVGVYLDHSAGFLEFYSVSDTMTLLHRVQTTFTRPLYAGVRVYLYESTAEFCKLK